MSVVVFAALLAFIGYTVWVAWAAARDVREERVTRRLAQMRFRPERGEADTLTRSPR